MHIDPFYGLEHWMHGCERKFTEVSLLTGVIPALNNLSLKSTYPFADTSYRDRNSKSQSEGGRNCEDAKQGTSEEKGTKTGFRK
jgi:hypothetical protein